MLMMMGVTASGFVVGRCVDMEIKTTLSFKPSLRDIGVLPPLQDLHTKK